MTNLHIEQIRRDPSALVSKVESGEPLTILRDREPVAEVRPVPATTGRRPIALCRGELVVPDDFDAPLPDDILREFEG